ncbi:hypothetical protein KI387_022444, partial [Taxus chinensis]
MSVGFKERSDSASTHGSSSLANISWMSRVKIKRTNMQSAWILSIGSNFAM